MTKVKKRAQFDEIELNFSQIEEIVQEGHLCGKDSKVIKLINQEDFGISVQRLSEKRGINLREAVAFLQPFYA